MDWESAVAPVKAGIHDAKATEKVEMKEMRNQLWSNLIQMWIEANNVALVGLMCLYRDTGTSQGQPSFVQYPEECELP